MANNKEIAHQILTAVGGASNLKDATHCMTRLRLYLKDDSIPKDEEVKAIGGVLGVVRGGQQYQVIIGTNVPKVYEELCKLANLTANAPVEDAKAAAEDAAVAKPKLTPKQVGKNIMGYMAGCMTPLIPVLLAGALFRCINSLCGPELLGLYPAESDLYILFDFLYDAAFYFMPILAGFNAAKQLGITPMLGGFIGCILMVPDFAAYATSGEPFTVFGIPCTVTNYAQTVLPIMLSVFFFSVVYKLIKKIMPDVLTTVFTPFLSMLISIPFILCLLAPLGTIVGNAISNGLAWFGTTTGFFGVAVIAALWEFLVLSGMHLALMMPMMASFFETGIQSGPMVSGSFATWACFGVALGAALRLRNKEEKSTAFASFTAGILGGITEPTLYGICFRYSRCFVTSAIGAFVGGAYAGITNVCAYAITFVFTGVQIGKRTAFGSWKAPADGKPLLYSSLGTAFNNWPEYYPILFDAVRDLDIHVFAALGSIDPASLQDVPANVELGQMVPQLDILSQASVFITHAGMGGTGESIYYGVPMIAIPQMDEQAVTAGQIEKLGLGIAFHGKDSVTSQGLKMAIETILQNDSYRETLQEFSADMHSLGGAKASADALVRFLDQ